MTPDEISQLAEKALPCAFSCCEAGSHVAACPASNRPAVEAVIREACVRVLEEAEGRLWQERDVAPVDFACESLRALAAALKENADG